MRIGFDPAKSAKNAAERRMPFERVVDLEWERAFVFEDTRVDYGERRMIALVPMTGRLHVVCYTQRGDTRWIISFRKANRKEVIAYAKALDR